MCYQFAAMILCPSNWYQNQDWPMDYVFDQLARYTMRNKESDLHLGLYSSANNLNLPTPLTLFYFSTLLYLLVQV